LTLVYQASNHSDFLFEYDLLVSISNSKEWVEKANVAK